MADTTVPEPKENGLYSASLDDTIERLFIQNVQNALAVENFGPEVGEGNAGQLLFVIGREAVEFRNLLKWPDSLSTLESCNDYLESKPDFWRLLAEVHQKTAYAWLIEKVVGKQPTLRDYLFPAANFLDAQIPELTIRQPRKKQKTTTTAYSASTSRFDPGAALDWSRIPYRVYHNNDLQLKMRKHLEELLSNYPAAAESISEDTKMEFGSSINKLKGHEIGSESSVSTATSRLLTIVELAYKDLTGNKIESFTELPSACSTVITDYVLLPKDSDEEEALLLWENKAPFVFDLHIGNLQKDLEGDHFNYNLRQTTWENWQAILANIAWHSSDLDKKPVWAIVYGGNDYIIIHIVYVKDMAEIDRPILYCSDIHSASDVKFPITSVALYMALSSGLPKSDLLESLQLEPPSLISPVLTIKNSSLRQATPEEVGKLPAFYIRLGERGVPRRLSRGLDYKEEHKILITLFPEETPELPRSHEPLPTIFLQPLHKEGCAGITYISADNDFVVKTSLSSGDSREMLRNEAAIYERLSSSSGNPKYYGIFNLGENRLALVLSYEGEPVLFNSLSNNHRRMVLEALIHLHEAGIKHGDFEERNVVRKHGGQPVIIDFSHSSFNHKCKGEDVCEELLHAKAVLGISDLEPTGTSLITSSNAQDSAR